MKTKLAIAVFIILLLVAIGLSVSHSAAHGHDPRDLAYWGRAGATRDWSSAAAHGDPQAEFFYGFASIRTNLETRIDRIPRLSGIPAFGKRFFTTISYGIDSRVSQEQLIQAYRWIKQSADQGFPPAKEAQKLFMGRIGMPSQGGPSNASQPFRVE
jgi:TPR repeat protein